MRERERDRQRERKWNEEIYGHVKREKKDQYKAGIRYIFCLFWNEYFCVVFAHYKNWIYIRLQRQWCCMMMIISASRSKTKLKPKPNQKKAFSFFFFVKTKQKITFSQYVGLLFFLYKKNFFDFKFFFL